MEHLKHLVLGISLICGINYGMDAAAAAPASEQRIQIFELPRDSVAARQELISLIDKAQSEILVAMYIFTDEAIINKLGEAARRGVSIQIIVDESTPKLDALIDKLLDNGIIPVVFPSGNPAVKTLMHHKFLVFDGQTVWTGSANFSGPGIGASARGNYENIVVIDSSQIAQNFTRIFYAEKREIFSLYINLLSNNAREGLRWFIPPLSQLHHKGLSQPYHKEGSLDFQSILKEEWTVATPEQRGRFRRVFPWFDESKLPPQEEREESQSSLPAELFWSNESQLSQEQEQQELTPAELFWLD